MNKIASEVYVIDMDEAVYDTGRAFHKMSAMAVAAGMATADQLHEARAMVEASGGSFDLTGYLLGSGSSETELDEMTTEFGDNGESDDFLYEDAHALFTAIDEADAAYYILTKGGTLTQVAKLRSADLYRRPHLITDDTRKGQAVARSRTPEGLYAVRADVGGSAAAKLIVARSAFVVEDKAAGFDGLPENCSGAWVVRSEPRESQRGTVPERVMRVSSLYPVVQRIRKSRSLAA